VWVSLANSSGAVVLLPCQPAAAVCCLLPARCTAVRLYCWPLLSVALSVSQRPRLLRHCLAAGCWLLLRRSVSIWRLLFQRPRKYSKA
jgi:hypothetical protein